MRAMSLGAAGIALLVTIAACGGPPPEREGLAAAERFPQGELLVAAGGSAALYSDARGKRSLGNVYPFDLSPDGSSVLAARSEQEPTGITRSTELLSIDTTSAAERVIVRAGDRETLGPARWSPDGSRIAYRRTTYEEDPSETHPGERATDIMCVRALSAAEGRCFDQPRPVYSFDWFPDGRSLLLADREAGRSCRLT